jgi:tetratricopeptide (TPR) repeat protein
LPAALFLVEPNKKLNPDQRLVFSLFVNMKDKEIISIDNLGFNNLSHSLFSLIFVDMKRILTYSLIIGLISCTPSEEELISKARELLDNNEPEQTIKYLNRAIEKNNKNPESLNMRGVAYFQSGENKMAVLDWDKAIKLDSMDYKPHYNRGNALVELENYREAIAGFSKAIKLQPNVSDIYINRASAWVIVGQYEMAIEDYNFAIRLDKDNFLAHFNRGKTLVKIFNLKEAEKSFQNALEIDNRHGETYYWLGYIHINLGDSEKGCSDLKKAESLGFTPGNQALIDNCNSQENG